MLAFANPQKCFYAHADVDDDMSSNKLIRLGSIFILKMYAVLTK